MNGKKAPNSLDQFLLVPVFVAAIVIFLFLLALPAEIASRHVYEPPHLLLALNTLFISSFSLWIAWQALRGYLASGLIHLLVLGCALLPAGIVAFLAGFLIDQTDGVNKAVTVFNAGFLLSAVLHFINAHLLGREPARAETEASRKLISWIAYLAVFMGIGGVWAAAQYHDIPPFYEPGVGPTMIRQVVLTSTILLLGVASHLIGSMARQRQSGYLRWYGYGLGLIALGLFGVALAFPGSPLCWAGRALQYLGNLYLLAASVSAVRQARHRGMRNWEEAVQVFFQESEGHYRALVESARSSIVSVDREGRVFLWNTSAVKLFGYSEDEVMGQALAGLIAPPESREKLERLIRRSSEGIHGLTLRKKDGSEFAAEFTVYGLKGRDEKSLHIRDITERKQAEDDLLKSKETLRLANEHLEEKVQERTAKLYAESLYARNLIEASLDPLVTISIDGKITDVNRASEEVTGVSRQQLVGSDFSDYFTEPDKARAGYEEVFRQGIVRDYPLELKRRDGHVTPVLYNATVYRDETGQILGVFAAARDITERRRAEEALRKLASELVMAEERERKRIAGVIHDEVAQTLAAVRMRVDLLQSIPTDQRDKQTVEEVTTLLVQAIQETRGLINDLGNPILFDLGLKAACEEYADRVMEIHPVRISCDIGAAFKELNPDVKTILYQMVREFLNNVVKHSHAQNAHVMIGMENGNIQVKVTDDGVGFDPQTAKMPTVEGGFGLYSIRERLIAVNGSLRIVSAPSTGTVVTASLPTTLD
jgi:PAS domain S-box-containing protein